MWAGIKQFSLLILFVVGLYAVLAPITSYWMVTEVYAYFQTVVPEWLTYIKNLIK